MGRKFTASFDNVAVSLTQDLFEIKADASVVVRVLSVDISDADGTASSQQLRLKLSRGDGAMTGGSGGSTLTPTKHSKGGAAAKSVVKANNTTKMVANGGTINDVGAFGFNIVGGGYQYLPVPEAIFEVSPSDYLVVTLMANPTGTLHLNGTVVFEELGG